MSETTEEFKNRMKLLMSDIDSAEEELSEREIDELKRARKVRLYKTRIENLGYVRSPDEDPEEVLREINAIARGDL